MILSMGVLIPKERLPDILIKKRQTIKITIALKDICNIVKSFPLPKMLMIVSIKKSIKKFF